MTKHLYTTKDVKEVREDLFKKQSGIDPVLKERVNLGETCLDHDHVTQKVRGALHRQVNSFEGRVTNAYKRGLSWLTDLPLPDILRNLAEYLEQDFSKNPVHPSWMKHCQSKFNSLSEPKKKLVLQSLGKPEGQNAVARKAAFKAALLSRQFTLTHIEHIIKESSK